MRVIDIDWDVDYPEDAADLPTEIDLPYYMSSEDEISDYITDLTGFCHYGFVVVDT